MHALAIYEPFDPRVEAIWRGLEAIAHPPYFLSWSWIENWLANVSPEAAPQVAVVVDGDVPIAACFLGRQRLRRHGFVPSTALYLNATGAPRADDAPLPHNGLLHVPGSGVSLESILAQLPGRWDELYLPAVAPHAFPELGRVGSAYHVQLDHDASLPFVDLEIVRAVEGGYASVLPAGLRAQLRHARRAIGELTIEPAATVADAHAVFDELRALAARTPPTPDAFARHPGGPWHERLDRRLIEQRHGHGELELLRIHGDGALLGCLFNLTSHRRTVFYRAAFVQVTDPQREPALLCYAAAIERCAAAGDATCDLLAGDASAMHHLATGETRLAWLRVQRPLARFSLEARLRGVRAAALAWRDRWLAPLPGPA